MTKIPKVSLDCPSQLLDGSTLSTVQRLRDYMTTEEAADYMRKGTAWLLRQADIPYLPGRPNLYLRADLDDWFERNKHKPRI